MKPCHKITPGIHTGIALGEAVPHALQVVPDLYPPSSTGQYNRWVFQKARGSVNPAGWTVPLQMNPTGEKRSVEVGKGDSGDGKG